MPTYEVLSPEVCIVHPEVLNDETLALLTFPSMGDRAQPEGYFLPEGNCIKDAQSLADALHRRIVVANRRSPHLLEAWSDAYRKAPGTAYNELAKRGAESIARSLGDYALQLSIYGESGGAAYGLSVARSQELPIQSLAVYDPVGLFDTNFWVGLRAYVAYIFHGEAAFKKNRGEPIFPEAFNPTPPAPPIYKQLFSLIVTPGRQFRDIFSNGHAWASRATLDNVLYLRDATPRLGMAIDFPESSLALIPSLANRSDILSALRQIPVPREARYEVRERQSWTHGSINIPAAHLELARRAIAFSELP